MANELLRVEKITKKFGQTEVLKGVDLSVAHGEFLTILGSSGCGKTTLLRIIAGLEEADSGSVFLDGKDVTFNAPNKRNLRMVFQNYALFPHMNVAANIGYSLRIKGVDKKIIRDEVDEALKMVRLTGYEKRMPPQLSGGQRQRVAMARALVGKPPLLLLDEPLGALDLQLRREMQIELKDLQKETGVAFIYITHDQEEALTMSDRIALMRSGLFEQVGSVAEIYDRPVTSYAARFVGSANIIRGEVTGTAPGKDGTIVTVETGCGKVEALCLSEPPALNSQAAISVRAEDMELVLAAKDGKSKLKGLLAKGLPGKVTNRSFAGGLMKVTAVLADGKDTEVSATGGDLSAFDTGDDILARWSSPDKAFIVDDRYMEDFR